jgi:Ferric iron reductase FhuF-like transporter/FhuF 2Fe-2S C-terminal domain
MSFATATAVLGDLAALGPFFAVDAHRPGELPCAAWRSLSELTTPSEALRNRIGVVRGALAEQSGRDAGQVELRVAASIAHLGLVARLAAPAIAVAAAGHRLDLRPAGVWWQDVIGGPVPLSVPASASASAGPSPERGMAESDRLLDGLIGPLTVAVAELVPVSERVLWGNVASAVNGAAAQIARQRPEIARQAWLTAAALFRHQSLHQERVPPGPRFCRSSCCLRYRVFHGTDALCGDCVLTVAAARRAAGGSRRPVAGQGSGG